MRFHRSGPGRAMGLAAASLLLLGTSGAAAQTPAVPARESPGLLATHAEARQRLPNTVVDASVSIEVHGRDLRTTATALARQSQSLLAYLRAQATERLRTEVASFTPELQEVRNAPDRIKGYTGTQLVTFRTAPDQLPAILAGSLDNGATSLSVPTAAARDEEVDAARTELTARAARSAMAQARAAAAAVGQRVTGVERLEIDPQAMAGTDPFPPSPMMERAAPARPVPPIAIEAGDGTVRVTVLLTVRLAPAE